MAKNLMEIMKARQTPQAPSPTSAQALAQQQSTLRTGKEVGPGTGPQMSNVAAQLAAQSGQQQQAQIATQGLVQNQALGQAQALQQSGFEQAKAQQSQQLSQAQQNLAVQTQIQDSQRQVREEQAIKSLQAQETASSKALSNRYAEALANLASEKKITEQDIFMQAGRERSSLGLDKYNAYLDQAAHAAALSDQKYTNEIIRIGKLQGLQDAITFNREAQQLSFGQDYEILAQQFDMNRLINADEREFKMQMAQMDINTALRMAEQAAKEQAYTQMIQGTVGVGRGIIDYKIDQSRAEDAQYQKDTYYYKTGRGRD